jgi:glycosyltransferase involved in cell wall biosynthesis
MKILLVSHAPLTAELGAAQIALRLAAALRDRGHDAAAWCPDSLPPKTSWWNLWRRQREAVARFAAEHGPFDVIDTPAIFAGRGLLSHGTLVVRSIQPELLYLQQEVCDDLARHYFSPRSLAHTAQALQRHRAIVGGWRRARLIVCLGGIELAWMQRRFPRWRRKLTSYVCAPAAAERAALAEVRRRRAPPEGERIRFLWIGRWAAHKGLKRLRRWIAERLAQTPEDTITIAGCGAGAARDLPPAWLRSGRVRLVPAFSRCELPALLASHDAGVFTSTVEGWGLSLNEMLESGMPVYAMPAGGARDLQPFWQGRLRPFPPPLEILDPEETGPSLEAYDSYFSWPEIARRYERDLTR